MGREGGRAAGIARIVPPREWNPPFCWDRGARLFPTRVQGVHTLQARFSRVEEEREFRREYSAWRSSVAESEEGKGKGGSAAARRKAAVGGVLPRPLLNGRPMDLPAFLRAVTARGGFAAVCAGKIWREVARGLIPAAEHQSNTGYLMRIVYEKHLLAFEEHLTRSGHPMGVAAGGAKGVKAEPGGVRAGGQVSGRGGGGRGAAEENGGGPAEPPAKRAKTEKSEGPATSRGGGKSSSSRGGAGGAGRGGQGRRPPARGGGR